ncbi:UNVERIFIED_CONTAM: hypothetical protein HHA_315660 [Hammondia hammondi]|eukprot:XP_008883385.1 hypothetical protein HHA_315660 [Hammondia hammondi]
MDVETSFSPSCGDDCRGSALDQAAPEAWGKHEQQSREVYRQIRRQYLSARMYGAYEDMLMLGELLYSLVHPAVSPAPIDAPVSVRCGGCVSPLSPLSPRAREKKRGTAGEGEKENAGQREGEKEATKRHRAACCLQTESLFFFTEALIACGKMERARSLLFEWHAEITGGNPALLAVATQLLLKIDAPADLVAFLDRHRSSWMLPSNPSRTFLEMSLATALQRLGRFPQALRVLCDLYQREPFHPKLLFALFGSGVLTPEDELHLLRETKFDNSQLWARHLAVALLSAARDETPEAIWARISSSSSSSSPPLSSSSSPPSSSSSSSSFAVSPPRPPGLHAVPLAIGVGGCCLRVDDVLSYVEEMYPSRHIPPEFLYASVNLTIQAIRAFRRRNAPLAFALSTLLLETSLAEAVYVLPVFISCCVQLEKVAELHLLTERLEEALEGALADGERTTLTAALIHAEGGLLLVEGTTAKAIDVLFKATEIPQEPLTTPGFLPPYLLLAQALQSPVEGPTPAKQKVIRKKLVKTLRRLTQIFRGHARVRLALLNEIRRTQQSAQNASAEKSEEIQLLRGMLRLDSRDPHVLLECATAAFDSGRFYEALLLVNRALAGCTYTRETGPPCEPRSPARLACKEEEKKERRAPGELRQGDGTVLDDLFCTPTSHSPPCCFAADALHALRGQALVQLSRQVAASREFSFERDDFLFPRLPVREERTSSASSGDSCRDADSFPRSPSSPLPTDKASSSLSEKLLAEAEAALRTALAVNPDNVESQRNATLSSLLFCLFLVSGDARTGESCETVKAASADQLRKPKKCESATRAREQRRKLSRVRCSSMHTRRGVSGWKTPGKKGKRLEERRVYEVLLLIFRPCCFAHSRLPRVKSRPAEAATSPLSPSPLNSLRFHSKTGTEPPWVLLPRERRQLAERNDEKEATEKKKRVTGKEEIRKRGERRDKPGQ